MEIFKRKAIEANIVKKEDKVTLTDPVFKGGTGIVRKVETSGFAVIDLDGGGVILTKNYKAL